MRKKCIAVLLCAACLVASVPYTFVLADGQRVVTLGADLSEDQKIRFKVSKSEGHYTGFVCEGHAGYAEEGKDIVCSAVSALTINTVNSIAALTDDDYAVEQLEDGGYLKLELTGVPSDRTVLLMDSLILGMKSILEAYGEEYISISISQEPEEITETSEEM